jgi:hypothetical protein
LTQFINGVAIYGSIASMPDSHMQPVQLAWTWLGNAIEPGFDTSGQGPTVPALSSISTRREMWPLQKHLSLHRMVSVDWPGFGDQARPAVDWTPDAYAAFLEYILEARTPENSYRVSPFGTFETCRLTMGMSVNRGRPEVAGAPSK